MSNPNLVRAHQFFKHIYINKLEPKDVLDKIVEHFDLEFECTVAWQHRRVIRGKHDLIIDASYVEEAKTISPLPWFIHAALESLFVKLPSDQIQDLLIEMSKSGDSQFQEFLVKMGKSEILKDPITKYTPSGYESPRDELFSYIRKLERKLDGQ